MDDLQIVIGESDPRKSDQRQHRDPDIDIGEVRPEQRRHHDGYRDEHAAGPSSRIYCPIWNSRNCRMIAGPTIMPINSAVRLAKAVRKVKYRKMRNGGKNVC